MNLFKCFTRARVLAILPIFSILSGTYASALELSDVSVLLPLPATTKQISKMLSPSESGAKGKLLPAAMIQRLPQLADKFEKQLTYASLLRAVGVRFDPCFFEGTGTVVCRRQIRIIWQPVTNEKAGITTTDAALHTFYEFTQPEWDSVIAQYQTLLAANPIAKPTVNSAALGVNPRIKAQTLDGAFWTGLHALILKNCGEANFVRATAMTLTIDENEWKFLGFNSVNGQITPIQIAAINSPIQDVKTKKPVGFDLLATIAPTAFSPKAVAILQDSVKTKKSMSADDAQAFAEDILNIENPRKHNPGTIDCASCHMTEPAAQWTKLNYPAFDWKKLVFRSGWDSTHDLSNTTISNLQPRRFRAFGYFGPKPLISQRTINESAAVVDALEKAN